MSFVGDLFTGKKKTKTDQTQKFQFTPFQPFSIQAGGANLGVNRRGQATFGFTPGLLDQFGAERTAVSDLLSRIRGVDTGISFQDRLSPISQQIGGLSTASTGRFDPFISRLQANQNPFIEARVNPLIERLAGVPSGIGRDFARRGVFGSIPANIVAQAEEDVARAIGQETALATQEALGLEAQALAQAQAADQTAVQQELQRLGLGADVAVQQQQFDVTTAQQNLQNRFAQLGLESDQIDRLTANTLNRLQADLSALGLSQQAINAFLSTRQVAGQTAKGTTITKDPSQGLFADLLRAGATAAGTGGFGGGAAPVSAPSTVSPFTGFGSAGFRLPPTFGVR